MTNPDFPAEPPNIADPIERLVWLYEHPSSEALSCAKADIPVVGITSNTVPWELIRAAGAFPCMINSGNANHADISRFMEDDVFEERIRAVFGAAISGDLQHLSLLLIPRTSEHEYKLYLYLREVARQDPDRPIPPVYLYDLLHTRSSESYAYGLERTLCLKQQLEEMTGVRIKDAALLNAIKESNSARHAVRKLLSLRGQRPRVTGTEALALIGASYFMIREEYARLAEQAAELIEGRPPLAGKRLMIAGAPLNHPGLHQALEKHGAVVVAEDDWWGSRSAGDDIAYESNGLLKAIFEKYYFDSPSPRVFPSEIADTWFQQESTRGIDGVVFYLPPEDCVYGWDYPRRLQFLNTMEIPHLLVRENAGSIPEDCHERIERFVCNLNAGR